MSASSSANHSLVSEHRGQEVYPPCLKPCTHVCQHDATQSACILQFSASPSALSSEAASIAAGAVYVTPSKSDSPSSIVLSKLTGADIPTAESYSKSFVALMKVEEVCWWLSIVYSTIRLFLVCG
jgi:hypothetical protein